MKRINKWLLPVLTCLLALSAAVLPQQVSHLRDQALFSQVHADELLVDSGFPGMDTDLQNRIALICRSWYPESTVVTAVQEIRPGAGEADPHKAMEAAIANLTDAGVLPRELLGNGWAVSAAERVIYQDGATGSGASFLNISCIYGNGKSNFWCMVDEKTGKVCQFVFMDPHMGKYALPLQQVGEKYFASLGFEPTEPAVVQEAGNSLWYQLSGEPPVWYSLTYTEDMMHMLLILPDSVWSNNTAATNAVKVR